MTSSGPDSPRATDEDTRLMCRVKYENDHLACAELLRRIRRYLVRPLQRLLPEDQVEDGVAEVYLRLWQRRTPAWVGQGFLTESQWLDRERFPWWSAGLLRHRDRDRVRGVDGRTLRPGPFFGPPAVP
jgi:hypothetical protein